MELEKLLKRYFGFDTFRPNQREIMLEVMSGHDCLVLMPTGGGKSICYQLPALAMEGTAIVISPLISLMHDQVHALQANGIPAAALNSGHDGEENILTRRRCMAGELKLLYLSPEMALSEMHYLLKSVPVSLFAIDEAHCISQWGHDFRKEYTRLGELRDVFPHVPVMALTATADKLTREDIVTQLRLNGKSFISSFDRPNIHLEVIKGYKKAQKLAYILDYIHRHPGDPGIIYSLSRKDTEDMARDLLLKGVKAACYHAGMPSEQRETVQNQFKEDLLQRGQGSLLPCGHAIRAARDGAKPVQGRLVAGGLRHYCFRHGYRQKQRALGVSWQPAQVPGVLLSRDRPRGKGWRPRGCGLVLFIR